VLNLSKTTQPVTSATVSVHAVTAPWGEGASAMPRPRIGPADRG
jgi:hypothetical protein